MKTQIERGSQCLVINGDKRIEGTIVDALRESVKVKHSYQFWFIKWYAIRWYPIKGEKVRVEFKTAN